MKQLLSRTTISIAATLLLTVTMGTLQAAQPVKTPIDTLDKDKNGTVSEAEFNAGRVAHITNRARIGRPIQNPDMGPKFQDIDADGNGEATLEEFTAARKVIMAQRQAALEKARRERMKRMMPNMPPRSMGPPRHTFEELDSNRDGMISREEFEKHHAGQ